MAESHISTENLIQNFKTTPGVLRTKPITHLIEIGPNKETPELCSKNSDGMNGAADVELMCLNKLLKKH